jgi:dipeptidyl aminopeptidase/acylaminoacyl peptidase
VLFHRNPAPSRDGRRLAVEVARETRRLMRSPLRDGGSEPPLEVVTAAPVFMPAVSSDGSSVAVVTEHGGRQLLGKLSLRDGRLEVLREGGGDDEHPAWSPDGKRIAVSHVGGGNRRIALIAATGGDLTLLSEPEFFAMYPAWSPDGRSIAFIDRAVGSSIRIVPAGGGSSRRLWAGSLHLTRLSWSPDGRWIVTGARTRDGRHSVVAVPAAGGEPTTLIDDALSPTWLSDRRIAFLRGSGAGVLDLWTARVGEDGRLEPGSETPLTRLPRSQLVDDFGASTDGRSLYFTVWDRAASDIWLLEAP